MVTIIPALRQVREDLVEILDHSAIIQLCRELGHSWRDRQLDPYTMLHLFILQVLNNNTAMTHLLALILQANLHGVFRVHQRLNVDFRPHRPCASQAGPGHPTSRWIRRLGHHDQLVEWRKPASPPAWMTPEQFAQLPETIIVREIKWRIRESCHRVREVILVTTLLDPERYPAAEVAWLYGQRWQVEVDLRDLKITLGMDVLKGQSVDVVMKEVQVFVLVYNLVRLVTLKAARVQHVKPQRISFIDALRWLQPPKPEQALPDLVVNPQRPVRIEPRCIKRHMKEYDLMTRPRHILRKRLKKRRNAA